MILYSYHSNRYRKSRLPKWKHPILRNLWTPFLPTENVPLILGTFQHYCIQISISNVAEGTSRIQAMPQNRHIFLTIPFLPYSGAQQDP